MGVPLQNAVAVLSATAPQTATLTSAAVSLAVDSNSAAGNDQDFKAVFVGTWTPSGVGSPTFDGRLEASWDGGTTWITVCQMTQRTAAGSWAQIVDVQPGTKVRGVYQPGGSGGTHSWTGSISLASSGSFKLIS